MIVIRCTRRTWLDALLIVLFLSAISAPTIVWLLDRRGDLEPMLENRRTAPRPSLEPRLESLSTYPASFERWYGDTFGLRDVLLRWDNAFKLFAFGVSPASMLVDGQRGWYYYGDEQAIHMWRGVAPFQPNEIEAWKKALAARRDWLARRGIDFLFVIVPNKEQVYPEYFPARYNQVGPTRLDQLARSVDDVDFLDLRAALIREKAHDLPDDYVFHRLGTHWTARGAFAGCTAILERLRASHPELELPRREEFESRLVPDAQQDSMGLALYLPEILIEPIHDFARRAPARARNVLVDGPVDGIAALETFRSETGASHLPRIVLINDSFGPWLQPFLAEQCSRLSCTHTEVSTSVISRERPGIVIQMYTERALARPRFPWLLAGELIDRSEFEAAQPTEPPTRGDPMIEVRAPGPGFRLPATPIRPGWRAALQVRIDSPDRALLAIDVAEDTRAGSSWSVLLEAGQNDVGIVLPEFAAPAGWELRSDANARPLLIREFEIRMCKR